MPGFFRRHISFKRDVSLSSTRVSLFLITGNNKNKNINIYREREEETERKNEQIDFYLFFFFFSDFCDEHQSIDRRTETNYFRLFSLL